MRIDFNAKTKATEIHLTVNERKTLDKAATLLVPISVNTAGDCQESAKTGATSITEVLSALDACHADAADTLAEQAPGVSRD